MFEIDPRNLKRKPDLIKGIFTKKGNQIVVNQDVQVLFPERYINKELATVDTVVKVVSIFAIVDENNNYAITNAPVIVELTPNNISEIIIEKTLNKVLEFNKGDTFMLNTKAIRNDQFMYNLFEEFYITGNTPWFMAYSDISDIFIESKKYAGSKIGNKPIAFEILAGTITRSSVNTEIKYRVAIKGKNDKLKPMYAGLNNVYQSYTDTGSKLVGSYYDAGINTALVDKEKRATTTISILRD